MRPGARAIAAVVAAVLLGGGAWIAVRGAGVPRPRPLAEILRPTMRESLAGVEMGLQPADREVLVSEAPDIDVVRAEARAEGRTLPDAEPPPPGAFLVADFDKDGATEREWNCLVGSWISDPTDPTIRCLEAYDPVNRFGEKGYGLKLWYDLESPNPAYGGLWIKFEHEGQRTFDASAYRALRFAVKGSATAAGFSTRIKIELKGPNQVGVRVLDGIGPEWRTVEIPLHEFKGLTNRGALTEMAIVIDKETADDLEGILYFDDLMFVQ